MASIAYNQCKGYNMGVGYNRKLNSTKRVANYVISTLTEKLDKHLSPLSKNRGWAEGSQFLPSEKHILRHDRDQYYTGRELVPWESVLESKLQHTRTQQSQSYLSDNKYRLNQMQNTLSNLMLATSHLGDGENSAFHPISDDEFSNGGPPIQLVLDDSERVSVPGGMDMWNCPPPTIFQVAQSPHYEDTSDLLSVYSNPITMRTAVDESIEDPRFIDSNGLNELKYDESMDGLFLYVTTDDAVMFVMSLRERGLEVRDIGKTKRPGVLAVVFKTHEVAKRAFTTQKDIGIRMVPPNNTKSNWFKNPTPNFHVKFETKRRLTVKTGKSISKEKRGDFLMVNARMDKGCIIWADQLKGHRLRVVGFVGKFKSIDGRIIEQSTVPSMEDRMTIGWISTQCNKTKKKYVLRKSGNRIEDYTHTKIKALE